MCEIISNQFRTNFKEIFTNSEEIVTNFIRNKCDRTKEGHKTVKISHAFCACMTLDYMFHCAFCI